MSGGIDSAVAALLLQRQGYPVEGVFMQNWDPRIESERSCEAESDYRCAARVASILRIPLRRVNFVRQYWQNVFERVVGEYSVGGTPNPDVLCNREIKFGSLFQWSQSHGYSHLATGHYARIIAAHGRRFVGQAECIAKDQSYFLADVPSSTLDSVMFPLGDVVSKERVRRLAAEAGLDFLLERPESMGMCFIGKRRRFAEFLLDFVPAKRAEVIDIDTGRVLEQPIAAETIAMSMIYTLGQSVRIGGLPAKMFVVKKCPSSGRLFVSRNREHPLLRPRSIIVRIPEESDVPNSVAHISCTIRSAEKTGIPLVHMERIASDLLRLTSPQPFLSPAPGQAAVLYEALSNSQRIVRLCGWITDDDTHIKG